MNWQKIKEFMCGKECPNCDEGLLNLCTIDYNECYNCHYKEVKR